MIEGADVRVGGIHKGTVKRIDLPQTPDGKVTVYDTTQGALRNVEGTADNLQAISSKINRGQGTAGALVNDKKVYDEQHRRLGSTLTKSASSRRRAQWLPGNIWLIASSSTTRASRPAASAKPTTASSKS